MRNLGLGAAPRCQSLEQAVAVVALLLPAAFPGHTETPREGLGAQPLAGPALPMGFLPQPYSFAKPWGFGCQGVHGEGVEGLVRALSPCCAQRSSRCTCTEIGLVPLCTCAPCLDRLLAMGRVGVQGGSQWEPLGL